jgi:hypothetical protein
MLVRPSIQQIAFWIASLLAALPAAKAADYRGAPTGWPTYANGTYAANYPASYSGGAYFVARPVAAAGYASPAGTMYMPTTAAYANPNYFAAYGRAPTMYQPTTAGYAPAAGGYYVRSAGYGPVATNYAPANSYAVTPAGNMSAGSEAAAYYGQPYPVNYVQPAVSYRPAYQAVPVYMYRPVAAYQPVTAYQPMMAYQPMAAQPTTCLQASSCTGCMPRAPRCGSSFSWLNPFNWFRHGGGGCGNTGCGAPPTTAYCNPCGQPYYPTTPVVPVTPVYPTVPGATPLPSNVIPSVPQTYIPPAGTRIPPPPTMAPGTRTIISPADVPPSLAPRGGTQIVPSPGSTFSSPQGGMTPIPAQPGFGNPQPGGSFQATPGATPLNPNTGSFGTGTNYPPAADPYSTGGGQGTGDRGQGSAPNAGNGSTNNNSQGGPAHNVFGSGFRSDGVIRSPDSPPLPPGVQTVPDLDAPQAPQPLNSAPKLLDPRDKTALRDPRWAVVPALWPSQSQPQPQTQTQTHAQASGSIGGQLSERPVSQTKAFEPAPLASSPYAAATPNVADYDERGWKTAAF